MWADGSKHYYVGELAQLQDGRYVVLRSWFRHESKAAVHADAWEVIRHHEDVSLFAHWPDCTS